jgi:hypothetical protein
MPDRHTCVDCHGKSPETNTDYTLISAEFGWRLSRERNADGTVRMEWRCPNCWRAFKASKDDMRPPMRSTIREVSRPEFPMTGALRRRR